jgi:hypothetical protein
MSVPLKEDLARKLVPEVRAAYPAEMASMGDDLLYDEIQDAMRKADEYGIEAPGAIWEFILLSVATDPKFYSLPEVEMYLAGNPKGAADRFSMLVDVYIYLSKNDSSRAV